MPTSGAIFEVGGGFMGAVRWTRSGGKHWNIDDGVGPIFTAEDVKREWNSVVDFDQRQVNPEDPKGDGQPEDDYESPQVSSVVKMLKRKAAQRVGVLQSHLKQSAKPVAAAAAALPPIPGAQPVGTRTDGSPAFFTKDWTYPSTARPGSTIGRIGEKSPDDVVVVSAVRTALAKGFKGSFKDTPIETLVAAALKGACDKAGVSPAAVGDVSIAACELGKLGYYGVKAAMALAGMPETVAMATSDRQCSGGLSAVAYITGEIRAGIIDAGIGGGFEHMTATYEKDPPVLPVTPEIMANHLARDSFDHLCPMGITSENVAQRYGVTREEQDRLAVLSHERALAAQEKGWFDSEIIPVTTKVIGKDGNPQVVTVTKDEGPRPGTTLEKLAKLKPVFIPNNGTTTAGNSSQLTDGAAAVLLMRRSFAQQLGVEPIAAIRAVALVGVPPDVMGIGPRYSIPEVLTKAGLGVGDIAVYEVNEAFASQCEYTIRELGLPRDRVNPCGGAMALGHPMGATGARQIATILPHLRRIKGKLGVTSMCIGTGQGMACVIENEKL